MVIAGDVISDVGTYVTLPQAMAVNSYKGVAMPSKATRASRSGLGFFEWSGGSSPGGLESFGCSVSSSSGYESYVCSVDYSEPTVVTWPPLSNAHQGGVSGWIAISFVSLIGAPFTVMDSCGSVDVMEFGLLFFVLVPSCVFSNTSVFVGIGAFLVAATITSRDSGHTYVGSSSVPFALRTT